jgi:hypothetical protein
MMLKHDGDHDDDIDVDGWLLILNDLGGHLLGHAIFRPRFLTGYCPGTYSIVLLLVLTGALRLPVAEHIIYRDLKAIL